MAKAVVCFSGGQDSTTALALALKTYDEVYTIGFYYGQTNAVELLCRTKILKSIEGVLGVKNLRDDLLLNIESFGQLSECALTRNSPIFLDTAKNLPTTFVPARNLLFATYASAYAYRVGAKHLLLGVSQLDYSGYPDCREEPLKALEKALSLGMDYDIKLVTPFMWKDKASEWQLCEKLGGKALVNFVRDETHTCYKGDHTSKHDWGFGCGECPACKLRAEGYSQYLKG